MSNKSPGSAAPKRFSAWRDVDHERRVFGFTISRYVLALHVGKRHYRVARFR